MIDLIIAISAIAILSFTLFLCKCILGNMDNEYYNEIEKANEEDNYEE